MRRKEGGFALLMVFVMAAVIAITLYTELPRVAFESQRAREQLLVDRGNEYKRGIQLFYRKLKRFPMKLEDLETTNNIRFLRRRYKDPLTGKDEWRLIHVGAGGFLTDSLVQKPNPLAKDPKDIMAGVSNPGNTPSGTPSNTDPNQQPQLNANGTEGGGGINMATARRPSDQMIVAGGPGGGAAGQPVDPNQQMIAPQYGAVQPPAPGQYQGQSPGQYPQQPLSGLPQIVGQPPQMVGQTPQDPNQAPQNPTQFPVGPPFGRGMPTMPGQPGQVGQPGFQPFSPGQGQGQFIVPQQQYPGQPLTGQPQMGPGQFPSAQNPNIPQPGVIPQPFGGTASNAAITAIQSSLFSPRQSPTGLGGAPDTTSGLVGGIAGVASTYKGEGIKRVNDKKKYQEWEFVYDLKQDKTMGGSPAVQPVVGPQPSQMQGPTPFQPAVPNQPVVPTQPMIPTQR